MTIIREKKFYSFCARDTDEYIGMAVLENETWIMVRENGTAFDRNGKKYVKVSEEITVEIPKRVNPKSPVWLDYWDSRKTIMGTVVDTDLRELGWTTDANDPVILPLQT